MNITDYVVQYRNKTFKDMPLSEVDGMVFAQMAYYNFSELKKPFKLINLNDQEIELATRTRNLYEQDPLLLKAIAYSKRFQNIKIVEQYSDFDIDIVMQFSVTAFELSKGYYVVAFRGTDGTAIGWKEDLEMTYMFPVPAQDRAEKFLRAFLKQRSVKKVIVVGHSKGGNLAAYASAKMEKDIQDKIEVVYNYDGPGFFDYFYTYPTYKEIKDRIFKFIPPQSCVGRLLHNDKDTKYRIVNSDRSFLMQHWAHSWIINQDGTFDFVSDLQEFSENMNTTSDDLLVTYTATERRELIDLLFKTINNANVAYMDDLYLRKEDAKAFYDEFRKLPKDDRTKLLNFITTFLKYTSMNYILDKGSEWWNIIKDTVSNVLNKVDKTVFVELKSSRDKKPDKDNNK